MEVKDKAAYESLRQKYDLMTSALSPHDILPSLFAGRLISLVQKQEIECTMHERGPPRGCAKLLDMLMSNGSEGAFQNFLGVLQNQPHLEYLVPELQSEYERQQSSLPEQTREQQVTTDATTYGSVTNSSPNICSPSDSISDEDFLEITGYLMSMERTDVYNLGLVLGLSQHKVKAKKDSDTFLDDVITAWLRREDQVIKRGEPSWTVLISALKHQRVGQTGIACKIAKDKGILL